MLRQIFHRLPDDGPSRDLLAVHHTCRAFRNVVVNDGSLKRRHQVSHQMAHLAMLVRKAADRATKPNRAVQCIPLLPLLNSGQRGKLVDVVVDKRNYGDSATWNYGGGTDWAGVRAGNVGKMAQRLDHLEEPHRTRLVETAIGFGAGTHAAVAISGFGTKLACLSMALRGQLVDKAVSLTEEKDRAAAIAGLSAGLAHLDAAQKDKLLTAAVNIEDGLWKGTAIAGLCKGWKHLNTAQQATLFNEVTNLPVSWRAQAIENLRSSLKDLGGEQWNTLVATTFDLLNQHPLWAPPAVCGLAAGLDRLTLQQRDTLVTESMARLNGEDKAKVIAALGARLADLTPAQQDQLLDAAAGLDTDSAKAQAIAGLAAGLACLDKARQDRVIGMALGISDNGSRAKAIAALAARLGDLEHEQHKTVVEASIALFKAEASDKETYRALGTGLGTGLRHLEPDLRNALISTLTRTLSTHEKRLRPFIAKAIAGLGAGRPHLDETEYQALIAAATRLQSRSGWAPFRTPDHSVIVAFAAEAAKALDPGA